MTSPGTRRNAVRFELQGNLEMDRLQFSRIILQTELGFVASQLDYIFALPGRKVFEVIFVTFTHFEQCIELFHQKKVNNPRLENITFTPLSERDARTVTVMMYSENISIEDVQTWLSYHCTVLRGMELRDQDGIRTGARRFYVRLKREVNTGRLLHLTSTIQLGPVRGHIFYQGQPKDCRKCGSLGHLAADCIAVFCKNCRSSDHHTRNCVQPMKCNLCGANTHSFRGCPQSYANRTRHQDSSQMTESRTDESRPGVSSEEPAPNAQRGPPALTPQQRGPASVAHSQEEQASSRPNGEEVLDWSSGPADMLGSDGTPFLPSTSSHLPWSSDTQAPPGPQDDLVTAVQDDPVAAQRSALVDSTAVSAKDCRDLLEVMMADLTPTPEGHLTTPDPGELLEAADEPPHSLPLFFDVSPLCQTPQKRQQETSGDSSPLSQQDSQVWPSPLSTSAPFLDPQCLNAFSSATQIKDSDEDSKWRTHPRKKKKKLKDPLKRTENTSPAP